MATPQGLLQETAPLDSETKSEIISNLWPSSHVSPKDFDCEPYFTYYAKQCHHALHDQGKHILVRTHQNIQDIAHELEALSTRDEIKLHLKSLFTVPNHPHEDEILDNSIDLATRIYLMLNIGASKYAISSHSQVIWEEGNLKDFLAVYFNQPLVLRNRSIKMERTLKACNLEKIAGIKIQWTDNMADHLRMVDDDDKIVAIFHHASFLKRQNRYLSSFSFME
jgi:hypothetical protein